LLSTRYILTGSVKEKRKALGLRQEDLARELEVVVSSVARWEQLKDGEVPNSKFLELALEALKNRRIEKLKKPVGEPS